MEYWINLNVLIFVLHRICVDTTIQTYVGDTVTLPCVSSTSYPMWFGPSENGTEKILYNYLQHPLFNPALGEKLSRISWSSDMKGLNIQSVRRTDNGTYECTAQAAASVLLHLIVRVSPKTVIILNTETLPSGRIVIKGTEDVELALGCLSVGGYPVASLNWYRDSGNTSMLINSFKTISFDNSLRTYNISAVARIVPSAWDDNIRYTCLSSFPDEPKLLTSTSAELYLDLKPSLPTISLLDTPMEGDNLSVRCQTSGFRSAESFRLQWSFRGSTTIYTGSPTDDAESGKFSVSAGYQRHVTRADNGQNLTCSVDHKTLKTPLTGSVTVRVLFPPLSTSITGNYNIIANGINRLNLTCTSGTSNPESNISWKVNDFNTGHTGKSTELPGDFNGKLKQQQLVLIPIRDNDGDKVTCEAYSVSGGVVAASSIFLDLRYKPLVDAMSDLTVIEGNYSLLECSASSKPPSNFRWFKEGVQEVLSQGIGNVNSNRLVYNITVVRRNDAATYRCNADNGIETSDNRNVKLIVHYPPDVDVKTFNTSVKANKTILECIAEGVPSTGYKYGEWIQDWPGYGIVSKRRGAQMLSLFGLTYEHSGLYSCSVSNGVKVFGTQMEYMTGSVYLLVKSFPIVIKPIIDTNATERTSAKLHSYARVNVEFYSNVVNTEIRCYRNQKGTVKVQHVCTTTQAESVVPLSVFEHTVSIKGATANIEINIDTEDDFGLYDIVIINDIGSVTVNLEVLPEGAPWRPENLQLDDLQQTVIRISWIAGFNGGFSQTFVIQLSTDQKNWFNRTTVDENKLRKLHISITGLQESKTYFLRVFAFNVLGRSNFSDIYSFTTLANDKIDTSPSVGALSGGIIGGLATLGVGIAAFILLRRLGICTKGTRNVIAEKSVSEAEMPVFQDFQNTTGPATYEQLGTPNVASESHEYSTCTVEYNRAHGIESSSPYEILGQKADVAPTYSSLTEDLERLEWTKANYENMKGQKEKICNYENTAEHQEKRNICKE